MVSAVLAGYGEKLEAKPAAYREFLRLLHASLDYALDAPGRGVPAVGKETNIDPAFFKAWFTRFSEFPVLLTHGGRHRRSTCLWRGRSSSASSRPLRRPSRRSEPALRRAACAHDRKPPCGRTGRAAKQVARALRAARLHPRRSRSPGGPTRSSCRPTMLPGPLPVAAHVAFVTDRDRCRCSSLLSLATSRAALALSFVDRRGAAVAGALRGAVCALLIDGRADAVPQRLLGHRLAVPRRSCGSGSTAHGHLRRHHDPDPVRDHQPARRAASSMPSCRARPQPRPRRLRTSPSSSCRCWCPTCSPRCASASAWPGRWR